MKGEVKTRAQRSTPKDSRRRHRARPTPRWLKAQRDLDDTARRRVLLVLSVLSGETPVTDAIAQAQVSRGLYYQLEERALRAMLRALAPGAEAKDSDEASGADGYLKRIGELEARLKTLETEKRRAERLLLLTRKVLPKGKVSSGRGRPPKATAASSTAEEKKSHPSSTSSGPRPSMPSPRTMPPPASSSLPAASSRMPAGAKAL